MTDKTQTGGTPDLAGDLAAIRADLTRLSDTMSALMRGEAEGVGAAVKGAAGDARNRISQAACDAQDSAFGVAANVERRIEKNPLTAVLIAAGIGMALGMMTKSWGQRA